MVTGNFANYTGFTGPAGFGGGSFSSPNSFSGDIVGMNTGSAGIEVPVGYVSNAALSDMMTFNNATFAGLGVTPGTYEWTWGTGVNQNFTLQIGPATVPDTGSTLGLFALALAALFGASRFRALRLA